MLSSHVKISPLLCLHNKSRLSHQKLLNEMVWYLIGVYLINRTLYFTRSLRSLAKYFSKREEKFRIFARPCNILYLIFILSIFHTNNQMRITNITINTKNKNLFTVTLESKTKTTLFTIGFKKSNLQKNYINI